ncbi:hypothetical protein HY408_02265 [Candidatus Gottesmanbacteria bacterium]|nr:hypothetical protein [Candidatus Gottesmanbacteria bacterium]
MNGTQVARYQTSLPGAGQAEPILHEFPRVSNGHKWINFLCLCLFCLSIFLAGYFLFAKATQNTRVKGIFYQATKTSFVFQDKKENEDNAPQQVPQVKSAITEALPSEWIEYTDTRSGIGIFHPPSLMPIRNDNTGVGEDNFDAGSFLVDEKGTKLLIFYQFPYQGGDVEETFVRYVMSGAVPSVIKKYILVSEDVHLDQYYHKLILKYGAWKERSTPENRVFYLRPVGERIIYFTYPLNVESDISQRELIVSIIKSSRVKAPQEDVARRVACFPLSYGQKDDSWVANLSSDGSMYIVQRTEEELSDSQVDLTRVEIKANFQDGSEGIYLRNAKVYRSLSKKDHSKDAFTISIPREDVRFIRQNTPWEIPSISILVKLSGAFKTISGHECHMGGAQAYFAQYKE